MKKILACMVVVLCLFVGFISANQSQPLDTNAIQVSPEVLTLDNPGDSFSVHSNIDFSSVDVGTLVLKAGGEELSFAACADSIGDLVLKLDRDEVLEVVTNFYNESDEERIIVTFVLTGQLKDDAGDIDESDDLIVIAPPAWQTGLELE